MSVIEIMCQERLGSVLCPPQPPPPQMVKAELPLGYLQMYKVEQEIR